MITIELIVFINAVLVLFSEVASIRRNSLMDKLIQDLVLIKDRLETIERYIITLSKK